MGEGSRGDTDDVVELGSGEGRPDHAPSSPAVPLLPAVAGRLETVHNSVSALGMRIDALGSLTSNVGSAMADRLTEYGDTVSLVTRAQTEALDEYRHGTERTVTELRRSLAASDEVIRRLSARIDELMTDTSSLLEIVRVLGAAPIRTDTGPPSSASDKKLDSLNAAVAEIASAIESALASAAAATSAPPRAEAGTSASVSDEQLDALHAAVADIASEVSSTMAHVPALRADLSAEVQHAMDELRAEVTAITSAGVAASFSGATVAPAGGEVADLSALGEELSRELVALRSEIAQLKRRIGVRAKSSGGLDEFQIRELAERIAESVRPAALADADIERIVAAVGAHFESTFEVVAEDVPPPPPPPSEDVGEKPSRRRR
jgi:uncharacterized coiled-coil protein SlyX